MLAGMIFKTATQALEGRLSQLEPPLTALQYGILRVTSVAPQTLTDISRHMMLDPSTLVPAVDALEQKGLISRTRDPQDRRRLRLDATQTGRERFKCVAAQRGEDAAHKDFEGFPIPAAAGLIASLTLFMLWLDAGQKAIGPWKFALPPLMLFLSFMMFSRVRYPSFKAVNWRTRRSIPKFIAIIVVLIFTVMNYEWMPAMLFISYLLYGLARPLISHAWRKEIESELGEDEEAPAENRVP